MSWDCGQKPKAVCDAAMAACHAKQELASALACSWGRVVAEDGTLGAWCWGAAEHTRGSKGAMQETLLLVLALVRPRYKA